MTKQVNFSVSKYPRPISGGDSKRKSRNAALCSNEDFQHIVQDSERARLINYLIQPEESREFNSFFHGQGLTPSDVSVSQFEFLPKQIVSTYPLESGFRFNPCGVTVDNESHVDPQKHFRCKTYGNISDFTFKEHGKSRLNTSSQTNILIYCERHTNTPQLKHACCGSCAPLPDYINKIAATQDYRDYNKISKYSKDTTQSILKKPRSFEKRNYLHEDQNFYEPEEAVRDTDIHEEYEPTKTKLRSCFNRNSDAMIDSCLPYDGDLKKKTLYNEGISDCIAHRYPNASISDPSSQSVPRDCKSRTSNLNVIPYNWIPFSYKIGSKYHSNCKENNTRHFDMKTMTSKQKSWDAEESSCTTIPRLPRKVLSSVRNIDQYVTKKKSKILISSQKCCVGKKKK